MLISNVSIYVRRYVQEITHAQLHTKQRLIDDTRLGGTLSQVPTNTCLNIYDNLAHRQVTLSK